ARGASTPALHDALPIFHRRRGAHHPQRAARGRSGESSRERQRHRHRPGGPAEAVSGVRAVGREPQPPLRRHRPRPRAVEATRRVAGRGHRGRQPARQRQHLLVHGAARLMATIVVVEDQPDNLKLITALLTMKGHRVIGLPSGEPLVATLVAERPPPDLVLLDIQLPGRDGFAVLADVRRLAGDHRWKVVALTAHAMPGDREHALAAGFDGYITKPIDVRGFAEEVARYLAPCVALWRWIEAFTVSRCTSRPPRPSVPSTSFLGNLPSVVSRDAVAIEALIGLALTPSS